MIVLFVVCEISNQAVVGLHLTILFYVDFQFMGRNLIIELKLVGYINLYLNS